MKQFYQEIIIEKSWQFLQQLKKKFNFILIGGWAVYLYCQTLKSKDIDLIVDFSVLNKLKEEYFFYKNERLKKYEIKKEGIDIDIYLPYFSHLGLPVEKLINFTEKRETFTVLKKEVLLIPKLKAYQERKASFKGEKDKIDILSLIFLEDFDFLFFKEFIKKNKLEFFLEELKKILTLVKEKEELGLNKHLFAQNKKRVLANL